MIRSCYSEGMSRGQSPSPSRKHRTGIPFNAASTPLALSMSTALDEMSAGTDIPGGKAHRERAALHVARMLTTDLTAQNIKAIADKLTRDNLLAALPYRQLVNHQVPEQKQLLKLWALRRLDARQSAAVSPHQSGMEAVGRRLQCMAYEYALPRSEPEARERARGAQAVRRRSGHATRADRPPAATAEQAWAYIHEALSDPGRALGSLGDQLDGVSSHGIVCQTTVEGLHDIRRHLPVGSYGVMHNVSNRLAGEDAKPHVSLLENYLAVAIGVMIEHDGRTCKVAFETTFSPPRETFECQAADLMSALGVPDATPFIPSAAPRSRQDQQLSIVAQRMVIATEAAHIPLLGALSWADDDAARTLRIDDWSHPGERLTSLPAARYLISKECRHAELEWKSSIADAALLLECAACGAGPFDSTPGHQLVHTAACAPELSLRRAQLRDISEGHAPAFALDEYVARDGVVTLADLETRRVAAQTALEATATPRQSQRSRLRA